ncbi:unnamed protein product [Allacma fusca]|uniref:Nuclear cap-binding protein subunit 3 n=1 Tax=Allacma fusca TaxID=39272 RepID=A0A8J2LC74_9HEXA|nr:unnamed protein product [Allacma fusca]
MTAAPPYESEKEDGELSAPNSPSQDDDEMAMEVDGVDTAEDEDTMSRGRSHSDARMPRSSSLEKVYRPRTYPNPYLNDVLVSEEKLNSRAARFGIQTGAQGNGRIEQPLPSDTDILKLYLTVGLIEDDGGEPTLEKVGVQFRLDSVLIRGTNHMSTNEIFAYLRDNNQRPLEMEWVNDACCVVIFKDRYEAARAMISMTKPVAIEPRPERKETEDGGLEAEDDMNQDFDFHAEDTVSSRYITVPMPPGYTWRFAIPCQQARGILMRYATIQDKKQEKSERHSEYYKKFGNPNYNVGFGLVSQSFRNRLTKQKSVEMPAKPEEKEEKQPVSNRLAWAQLSQRWNDEEIAAAEGKTKPVKPQGKSPTGGNQQGRRNESSKSFSPVRKNIKVLVDFEDRVGANNIKTRLKRRRVPPPTEGEARVEPEDSDSESDDEESKWSKKLKGPRMRMHADEEEQRMKERLRRQGGNRGRGGNVHARINNRLSWPGVYRAKGNLEDDMY